MAGRGRPRNDGTPPRNRPLQPSFFKFSFYRCEGCDGYLYAPLPDATNEGEASYWCRDCDRYYREPPEMELSEWQQRVEKEEMSDVSA